MYMASYKQMTERIIFKTTKAQRNWLNGQAQKTGVLVSEQIRRLIAAAMKASK